MFVLVYTQTKVQMRVFSDEEAQRLFSTLDSDKISEIELATVQECPAVIFDAPCTLMHNVFCEGFDT